MTDIADNAHADGASFLSIPDGYLQFNGTLTLSAVQNGTLGGSASVAYPTVTVEGSPLYFTGGEVILETAVGTPAINLLSLLGTSNSNSVSVPIQIQSGAPGTGGFNLKLHFNGATGVSASVIGSY